MTIVRIAYRGFSMPAPDWHPADLTRGYAYEWHLPKPPEIGDRVVVEGRYGQQGVVVGFGTNYTGDLLSVFRQATERELALAERRAAARTLGAD